MRVFGKAGVFYIDGAPHLGRFRPRIRVINLDTGDDIRWCRLADDVTGEWEAFEREPKNTIPKLLKGVARLRIEVSPCHNRFCDYCSRFRDNTVFDPTKGCKKTEGGIILPY